MEDLQFLFLAIRWNQSHDRRADHFVGGVSEDALRPEIPTGDDTVQILSDDRIVGRGDDGRQPARSNLGQMALGHVAEAPDAPRALPFNGEDFGITLEYSPVLQFQQVEALLAADARGDPIRRESSPGAIISMLHLRKDKRAHPTF